MSTVLIAHAVATFYLAGMIWTIQLVHYPMFAALEPTRYVAAMGDHARRITAVILVPWAVQGMTTVGLVAMRPAGVPDPLIWAAALVAALPVVVTVAASVPAHRELGSGFDPGVHARLVATNWLRTGAWSAHAVLAVVLLVLAEPGS